MHMLFEVVAPPLPTIINYFGKVGDHEGPRKTTCAIGWDNMES